MSLTTQLIILGSLFVVFFMRGFILCLPELFYWWFKDFKERDRNKFKPYGLYMFCGQQGAGKTMGLTYTLERLRKRYPLCRIYTNMGYIYEDGPLESLNDLLDKSKYNGEYGTIFVLDELQNEFSSSASKNFPESLLQVVTMQRKQKILILSTSQVFTRVAKPLREQCFNVIECFTFLGRYTRLKWYNADVYNDYIDNPSMDKKKKLTFQKKKKECFVQSDYLRGCYDSYQLIERLSRQGFAPKISQPDIVNVNVPISFKGKR